MNVTDRIYSVGVIHMLSASPNDGWCGAVRSTALFKYGIPMILITGTWCATFCRVAAGRYFARADVDMKFWERGQQSRGLPKSCAAFVLLSILVFERWFYVLWLLSFIFLQFTPSFRHGKEEAWGRDPYLLFFRPFGDPLTAFSPSTRRSWNCSLCPMWDFEVRTLL